MKRINQQPVHFIQLFENSYQYDKRYKSFADRKALVAWKEAVRSQGTLLQDKQLWISEAAFEQRKGELGNCVVAIDYHADSKAAFEQVLCMHQSGQSYADRLFENRAYLIFGQLSEYPLHYRLLDFKWIEDRLEVFLHWDYWTVGLPERPSFKIAELLPQEAVELKIDGLQDWTMAWRKERIFVENNLIIQYHGLIEEVLLHPELPRQLKQIPPVHKVIDLLKYVR